MVPRRIGYISVGIAACLLTGCSEPGPGVAQRVTPGVPEGLVVEPMSEGPAATWIEQGETFAVVTWGSGSCPLVATALAAEESDRIAVTFGRSPKDPCTADMAPTTHEFDVPDEVTGSPVVIEVRYEDWPDEHTLTLE